MKKARNRYSNLAYFNAAAVKYAKEKMGKLLRIKDYVLLSAAVAGEIFEEIRLVGGIMPTVFRNVYGFVPPNYKKVSYVSEVSRLLSTGNIEKISDKKGRVYFQLTSLGKESFKRRFPVLSVREKKWDGYFMVVVFDIEEKEKRTRELLRKKLIALGFGMLQESVWISPFHFEEDLREFLVSRSLGREVFVLKAKKLFAGNLKNLATKIWKLEEINGEYKKIIKLALEAKRLPRAEKKRKLKEVWNSYFAILTKDPFLPEEILPPDWLREKAGQEITFAENEAAASKYARIC